MILDVQLLETAAYTASLGEACSPELHLNGEQTLVGKCKGWRDVYEDEADQEGQAIRW